MEHHRWLRWKLSVKRGPKTLELSPFKRIRVAAKYVMAKSQSVEYRLTYNVIESIRL